MEFIHRHIEDIVRKMNSTFKGVLLTGARQTGKSTLLQELFPEKRYVPIDDPFIEAQANENPNEFMMLNPRLSFMTRCSGHRAYSGSSKSNVMKAKNAGFSACRGLSRLN